MKISNRPARSFRGGKAKVEIPWAKVSLGRTKRLA